MDRNERSPVQERTLETHGHTNLYIFMMGEFGTFGGTKGTFRSSRHPNLGIIGTAVSVPGLYLFVTHES
jgi:hypothetical protein